MSYRIFGIILTDAAFGDSGALIFHKGTDGIF